MEIKLLIFFMAIVCGSALYERKCPPKEDISCVCHESVGAKVYCSSLGGLEDLQKNLKHLEGYKIEKMTLDKLNVSTFPVDLFYGLKIEELVLMNVEVDDASFRPGRLHFHGLENTLHTLEIQKSFRAHRPLLNLKLDHMKVLRTIIFEHNNIPEVGNDWFEEGLSSLKTLIFEGNKIQKLGDKAFQNLGNLESLAIADDYLNDISRSMLPTHATKLDMLELSYNKIRELPADFFSNMPSLASVYLDHNLIHELKENTWSAILPQLRQVSLEGNPLNCDDKLSWVCQYKSDVLSGRCVAPVNKKGMKINQFCGN